MSIFGKPPIDPTVLAEKIVSALRHEEMDDRPHWNDAVRRTLCECADRKLCMVHPDRNEKFAEWLFDAVWFTREQGTILLAAEVELGNKNEVLYDFQKLLVVKAPLKVMVYYADRFSIIGEFKEYLEGFDHHVRGEYYLFIEMAPGPSDRAYVYKVQGDGRQSSVSFSPLDIGSGALTRA